MQAQKCVFRYTRSLRVGIGIIVLSLVLTSCGVPYKKSAPEVIYSSAESNATSLQIPPDLTDLSNGEQFVLPGTGDEPLSRNTLLPQIRSAQFIRNGEVSWLEVAISPESLWPELLAFLRNEKFTILRTEPTTGLIQTEWSPITSAGNTSVFKNLLNALEGTLYQRVALRLERGSSSSRLFLRVQRAADTQAEAENADQLPWPGESNWPDESGDDQTLLANNSELATAMLQRLLVHLGVAEQKASGMLNETTSAAVTESVTYMQTPVGPQLLIHSGYRQSYLALLKSLESLGLSIQGKDLSTGAIIAVESETPEQYAYQLMLDPIHVSEVKVTVRNVLGRPHSPIQANKLLQRIRDLLV